MKRRFLGIGLFVICTSISLNAFATLDGVKSDFDQDQSRGLDHAGGNANEFGVSNEWGDPGMIHSTLNQASDNDMAEITAAFSNPSVSLEDTIMKLLLLIMKLMDDAIERQTEKIEELQEQPSIDIETTKLKQLTEKRGRLFDTIKTVIDNYTQSAEKAIQSVR